MSIIYSEVDFCAKGFKNMESDFGKAKSATINPNTDKAHGLFINFKRNGSPDDVWLIGYMKSGTTWVQNIIWQSKNNLDFSASTIAFTYNLLETPIYHQSTNVDNFDYLDQLPSPRMFKSHLPAYLLPKELWTIRPKIIYTARNPKDIIVSMTHFINSLCESSVPKEVMFDAFLSELLPLSPVHDHVLSFWELRNLDNVLFTRYEDLLADQFSGVKRICNFLECSFTDQEITNLVDHLSFNNMKNRISMTTLDGMPMTYTGYHFCRKGKAGGYRDEMSEEYIKRFDEWTAERLRNTDFTYPNV